MAKVFKIQESVTETGVVILSNSGTFLTEDNLAATEYVFDHDYDVELTIDRQYFSRKDVLELRSFLDAIIEYQTSKGV